jgi:hypothetical protein
MNFDKGPSNEEAQNTENIEKPEDVSEAVDPQWEDLDLDNPEIKAKLDRLNKYKEEIIALGDSDIYKQGDDRAVRNYGNLMHSIAGLQGQLMELKEKGKK